MVVAVVLGVLVLAVVVVLVVVVVVVKASYNSSSYGGEGGGTSTSRSRSSSRTIARQRPDGARPQETHLQTKHAARTLKPRGTTAQRGKSSRVVAHSQGNS